MEKVRRWELDSLRGLMLVLMVMNHLPVRLSGAISQPVGFVSAAEGFVLLSAWLAGRVYTQRAQREGPAAMRRGLLRRAVTLHACHAALVLGLFCVVATLGTALQRAALTDLAAWFLEQPLLALPAALVLLYQPPLMDVLPLYVMFLLLSAPVLSFALRHGWGGVLAASAAVWALAQLGLGPALHAATLGWLGVPVPLHASGSFSPLAWQLLWFAGLALGARSAAPGASEAGPIVFPRGVVLAALGVATLGLVWRHAVGQTPFPGQGELNLLFSKWQLGPLRLLNLAALGVLVLHFGPRAVQTMPGLRVKALETLGRAALPVFCAHLVAVVAVLGLVGSEPWRNPWPVEALVIVATFVLLWGVARWSEALDARRGRPRTAAGLPRPARVLRASGPR